MKVSIHQPQFVPWINYFIKISESDHFIFLDTVSFQKNGIQNRNKILNKNGVQWITVPVNNSLGDAIKDCFISDSNWRKKIIGSLSQSYSKCAFYNLYSSEIFKLLNEEYLSISDLNIELTRAIMGFMGISTPTSKASDLIDSIDPTDRLISLTKQVGGKTYLSGPGGEGYIDKNRFDAEFVNLQFFKNKVTAPYPQNNGKSDFVPGMSVLDILFNVGDCWKDFVLSDLE